MEDTLREVVLYQIALRKSLNPCFNGRYSQSVAEFKDWLAANRLNPCFNGRYSQRCNEKFIIRGILTVLILVLMEDTLRVIRILWIKELLSVLILVLMEDTLRVIMQEIY